MAQRGEVYDERNRRLQEVFQAHDHLIGTAEWFVERGNIYREQNRSIEDVDKNLLQPMSPGKCNSTHFLTSGVPDRLGSQMSNYATLLIHSQRLEIIPFFPKRQKQILSAIFRFGQYIHTTKYSTNDMFTTVIFLY